VKVCKKATEEVVGTHDRVRKNENEEIKKLSEEERRLTDNINSTRNKRKRERIQERNKIMRELHKKMDEEEVTKIWQMVEEVERSKDDSRRMFQVVKDLQKRKEKKRIVVDGEDGKTTDEKE